MWIQVQAGAIFHPIKVMYMSSAQDFSLGLSICKAMQHDPTACTCWLPLVVCVSSFKTTLREAEGGQWWKWVWWGLNAPLHICYFLKQAPEKCQEPTGSSRACGAGEGQYAPNASGGRWRWENFSPPQLGLEENLRLALPQTQLISNIMEAQISFSQGQGANERAGSEQAMKQKSTETKKGI